MTIIVNPVEITLFSENPKTVHAHRQDALAKGSKSKVVGIARNGLITKHKSSEKSQPKEKVSQLGTPYYIDLEEVFARKMRKENAIQNARQRKLVLQNYIEPDMPEEIVLDVQPEMSTNELTAEQKETAKYVIGLKNIELLFYVFLYVIAYAKLKFDEKEIEKQRIAKERKKQLKKQIKSIKKMQRDFYLDGIYEQCKNMREVVNTFNSLQRG